MNEFLVRMIMVFSGLWQRIGVNPEHLEIILLTKLKMDGRRSNAFNRGLNQKKGKKGREWLILLYYFVIGALMILVLHGLASKVTAISVYLTIWMVLLALTLITDFTEVLLDVRDNYILFPRPVNDQTITISRLLHILLYLSKLTLAFTLPGMVYIIIKMGFLAWILFIFQIALSVVISILLVNILYLVLLRYTSQQKFKEIINYFQIGFVILIVSAYYIAPRLIDFSSFENVNILNSWMSYIFPSVWIASFYELLISGVFSLQVIGFSILGLGVPLFSIYLIINVFSKNFNQKLFAIGQESGVESKPMVSYQKDKWLAWWSNLTCGSVVEKAGFEIAWRITRRSRDYKLKTYPIFGFLPAYFIWTALDGEGTLSERWADLLGSDKYLFLLYLVVLGILTPLVNLNYSDKFNAAWIFYALPFEKPGQIIKGAGKVVFVRFVIPIYLLISILVFAVWGLKVLDDLVVGFVNVLLCFVIFARLFMHSMPFSQDWSEASKGSRSGWAILAMFMIGVLGFLHWLILDRYLILTGWLIIALIAVWVQYRNYEKLSWAEIK